MSHASPAVDPLFDPAVVQEPQEYYRDLRAHDPVHEISGTGTILVTTMADIHYVVAHPELFSSVSTDFLHKGDWDVPRLRPTSEAEIPEGSAVLAAADPPNHTRQRKVITRRLSTSNMQAMEPEFRSLVDDVLAALPADGRLEWMSSVAEPLPMVMIARILGLPDATAPELKRQGYAMVERISGFVPEDRILELEAEGINGLASVIDAHFKAREGSTEFDHGMIGLLAKAVADGELDDLEAMSTLAMIIAAGGESTTSLTGTAARILAGQPELQERLRTDPSLIPILVEESLRYDAPFRGHYRVATRDTEINGTPVCAGSRLVLMWSSANRDADAYECPDEVRLDRPQPRNHVGFGWGIHLCVGAALARVEAIAAIEALLACSISFRLDPDQPAPSYHESLIVRRLISLPLIIEGT
jgi:cytochrome P450 family 144